MFDGGTSEVPLKMELLGIKYSETSNYGKIRNQHVKNYLTD